MSPRDPHFRTIYAGLLKNAANFLESLYRLTVTEHTPSFPAPPEGSSIARHFAAYLALSGVTSWIYEIQDRDSGKPVQLLITKPQKSDTIKGFRAITLREWMKDVPDLNKAFQRILKDPNSYFVQNHLSAIPWFRQLEAGNASSFKEMIDMAGILASREEVFIKSPEAVGGEPDITPYDLFTAYQNPTPQPSTL